MLAIRSETKLTDLGSAGLRDTLSTLRIRLETFGAAEKDSYSCVLKSHCPRRLPRRRQSLEAKRNSVMRG
jgi:hypothetical protein